MVFFFANKQIIILTRVYELFAQLLQITNLDLVICYIGITRAQNQTKLPQNCSAIEFCMFPTDLACISAFTIAQNRSLVDNANEIIQGSEEPYKNKKAGGIGLKVWKSFKKKNIQMNTEQHGYSVNHDHINMIHWLIEQYTVKGRTPNTLKLRTRQVQGISFALG
ncbi:unnamed protein product [Owenia fusiformis]|uniref:Uncharacterized protein n=1 Tax=Owenia fusiformis TaxID=6347 RepID=A0A8S4N5S5_OWEFU|nr:unnamed protein product [Owenia fusiformis]